MFHRVARVVLEGFVVLAMASVVGVALAAWRFAQGPVALDALLPHIEPAVERALPGYVIGVDGAELAWRGWQRGLDLRLTGLRIDGRDGTRIARFAEATVRLSRAALLRGRIAPTALVVDGPELRVERDRAGAIQVVGLGGGEALPLSALVPPDDTPGDETQRLDPTERLSEIVISRAVLRVADIGSGSIWEARDTALRLTFGPDGARAEAMLTVTRGAHAVRLAVGVVRGPDPGIVAATVDFTGVAPGVVADMVGDLLPEAQRLAALVMPLDGRVAARFAADGTLLDAALDLSGVDGVVADGTLFPGVAPLASFRTTLRYDAGARRLDLARFELGFAGGGSGEATARMTHDAVGGMEIVAEARVADIPVDSLPVYWPLPLAPNARAWVTRNLSAGLVPEARFAFTLVGAGGGAPRATSLSAQVQFRGVTVAYLAPMPSATGVDGSATLALDRVVVSTVSGVVGGLRVESSRTTLSALDTREERADIQVAVRGPVRDQLALLDQPPLGFMKAVAMNPADFGGDALTRARFAFPLVNALRVDQVAVSGSVEARGFALRRAALGQDARDGEISGRFDEKGFAATGRLVLGRTPAEVDYALAFQAANPVRERIRASGVPSAEDLADFGFDLRPQVEGRLPLTLDFMARRGGQSELRLEAGLDAARLQVAELGWEKPAGVPGSARLDFLLDRGRIQRIRALRVAAGDLDVDGRIVFGPDGRSVQDVELDRLRFPRTDLRFAASRLRDGGWRLRLRGASADLTSLEDDPPGAGAGEAAQRDRPRLEIDAEIATLWLAPDRALADVVFRGARTARWQRAQLVAKGTDRFGRSDPFEVDYVVGAGGLATLSARSGNAGAMLRSLGITDKIVGGSLAISGTTEAGLADRPLAIEARILDYRLVDEPAVARFLSAALLTGLLDLLRGEGIGFDRLEARGLLRDGDVTIRDLRASGPSLGIQARGRLDLDGDRIDLEGTIVPANALNSLFGRIPIIGEVLFGPGLFAARYTLRGPRDAPDVAINPLSALAPGVLRNIFGLLEGGVPGGAPEPAAPPAR
jgi:hypothetical protein